MIFKARATPGAMPALAASTPVQKEARASAFAGEIRDAELLLTAFRTLLLLALIVVPTALQIRDAYTPAQIWLMVIASVYNIGMVVACIYPAKFRVRRPIIVAMDATLITAWLQLAERFDLVPLYYVVVVVAAMWYRVFGGVLAAAFCNFLFLYLWARMAGDPNMTAAPRLDSSMALNFVLLFVIGALAGYIAEAQERERENRLERELLLANYQQEIAVSGALQPLLISRPGAALHFDLGAAHQSARSVGGGDYLDAIALPDGRTLLCIADVSGKSVRAQARVPLLKYSLRALAPLHCELDELMDRLQKTLAPDIGPDLYIAVCLVALDAQNNCLEWCNAGHIGPLLVRGKDVFALESTGPALGLFTDIASQSQSRDLKRGDAFLLYTDGLSDALGFGGEVNGEEQVRKMALKLGVFTHLGASEAAQELVDLAEAVLEDKPFVARHFTLGEKLVAPRVHRDDVAVLVARFRG